MYQNVLPRASNRDVSQEHHDHRFGGHHSIKLLVKVRERFYCVNYHQGKEQCCRQCDLCTPERIVDRSYTTNRHPNVSHLECITLKINNHQANLFTAGIGSIVGILSAYYSWYRWFESWQRHGCVSVFYHCRTLPPPWLWQLLEWICIFLVTSKCNHGGSNYSWY